MKFTRSEVLIMAQLLGVDFKKVDFDQLFDGVGIELEHGKKNSKTNITDDDLKMTMKIALAHLYEDPNYYIKLKKYVEKEK